MKPLLRRAADWVDLQWSVLERSLRAVAPRARGRLLDVGCGDKPYEDWFRPFVSAYIGIEHGATFAATAAGGGGHGRPDVVYGAGTLPFKDGCFDTVLSVQVLEHTPRPGALMAEMSRVLARDGILILTAPFQFRLHEQPHDYFRYSPHGLRQMCADVGLEVFETIAQGSLWTVIGHKLNSYLALRVARAGGLAQGMGKLGHEAPQGQGVRWWTLPVVGPSVVAIAAGARLLDRVAGDPEESLGYLVLARHR
ncbi:MAG TPA: class I SAM-dependent methyltransferase [Polyangia bacterium]|nr:class I SAM-dependent methyltransferase [Polyangia bacterium]